MKGYELYWHDPIKGYQIIGVLPERRQDRNRITNESVLNWGTKYFGKNLKSNGIFFIPVTLPRELPLCF